MRDYIEERAVETAIYMIETKATVRQTAKKFGVSKSTVHKDLTSRLVQVNPELAASLNQSYAQHYVDNIPVYREADANPENTKHCCYPEASQE